MNNEWKPIATVPVDGTEVLAAIRVNNGKGKFWWERHIIAVDDETGDIVDTLYSGWDVSDYSHWHVIPDAPTGDA